MKNSVALIFIGNIEFCPYIQNYIALLNINRISYDVFFWDRAELNTSYPENYHAFTMKSELLKNKVSKLIDFMRYRRWMTKEAKRKNFDAIVFLDTLSAVLLYHKIVKRSQSYILEIRDYSYEGIAFFKKLEERIIKNSYSTFISSPGYSEFLPPHNYRIMHNISEYNQEIQRRVSSNKHPYVLAWTGTVRYYKTQVLILNQLGNDSRFLIQYHGTGPQLENLINFCRKKSIHNVVFTGKYNEKDKINLLKGVDMILNAYDISVGPEVKYALSNRFYDGLIFRIPQLVESGSYKTEIVENNGVGMSMREDGLADAVCSYLDNLDFYSFDLSCERLLKKYKRDNEMSKNVIRSFLGCN